MGKYEFVFLWITKMNSHENVHLTKIIRSK